MAQSTDTAFEKWWAETWESNRLPGILNAAFKELAQKAWDAAYSQAILEKQDPRLQTQDERRPRW